MHPLIIQNNREKMNSTKDAKANHALKTQSEIPRTLGFLIAFVGVFFLVATVFSLITIMVLQVSSGDSGPLSSKDKYTITLTVTSLFTALGAFYIGVKLIKKLDSGRKLFNIFSLFVIALAWAKFMYKQNAIEKSFANMPAELAANAKQIELGDTLTVFILPAILILVALLLNLRRSKDSLS